MPRTLAEEIDALQTKLATPRYAPLTPVEKQSLRQTLLAKQAADKTRLDARLALPAPQAGSSAAAQASRQNYDLQLQQIESQHDIEMLALDEACPGWMELQQRLYNYTNAMQQLLKLDDLQAAEDAAVFEAERREMAQPANVTAAPAAAAAPEVATEAARLALALRDGLPAAAPPLVRDHPRPVDDTMLVPAKVARPTIDRSALNSGNPARSSSALTANPLLRMLNNDATYVDMADKLPFMKEVAGALDVHSMTTNQQRFRQQAEALVREKQTQAALLDKAASGVEDPQLRAALYEASAASWRETAEVQDTHLRFSKASTVLPDWKETATVMTKGTQQEQDLVLAWANLSEKARAGLVRSAGANVGGQPAGQHMPQPPRNAAAGAGAAAANPNRVPLGGGGAGAAGAGMGAGCFFCYRNHSWRACMDFNRLAGTDPRLHQHLTHLYMRRGGQQA
ncbi:hypothetical protein GPECTOR_37g153 [Gonium pectorale]|uniref:Uncharacterized protein n=1 Tax=Gonium pectorale TaxID=33097 RepID=A0A150GBB7_GONPE|nr:hypothetical protein GPECTOR_37g153 [Gonium pectorale]|eukprot:KXZ47147.1 hypothetical protein GPECTOR_37g153 [Gonium pectorale]